MSLSFFTSYFISSISRPAVWPHACRGCAAICSIADEEMRPPGLDELKEVANTAFEERGGYLNIGAMGGTHLPIIVGGADEDVYTCYKVTRV